MSTPAPNPQSFDFDYAPAMKMFMDNMEVWKQNYENLLRNANLSPSNASAATFPPAEQALGNWKAAGDALFRSFVEQQVELCRFFGRRWENYLDYPRRLSSCKTPAEVAELEMDFLKKMAEDYSQESARLARPMSELMSSWSTGRFGQ